jgi:hypothetical protein
MLCFAFGKQKRKWNQSVGAVVRNKRKWISHFKRATVAPYDAECTILRHVSEDMEPVQFMLVSSNVLQGTKLRTSIPRSRHSQSAKPRLAVDGGIRSQSKIRRNAAQVRLATMDGRDRTRSRKVRHAYFIVVPRHVA